MYLFLDSRDRYCTRDSSTAQYLVHIGHRCVAVINDAHRPVYSFVDSSSLRADIGEFVTGATVEAYDYGRASAVVRRLTHQAYQRRLLWEQRLAQCDTGADLDALVNTTMTGQDEAS
jgi:hypothetical protein